MNLGVQKRVGFTPVSPATKVEQRGLFIIVGPIVSDKIRGRENKGSVTSLTTHTSS